MPGAKRRALKKLLSPDPSPSATPPPNAGHALDSGPVPEPIPAPAAALSYAPLNDHRPPPPPPLDHRPPPPPLDHRPPPPLMDHRPPPPPPIDGAAPTSIASNPNNYLTDQQLDEDLELEKMAEREKEIGSGGSRVEDGVRDLSTASVPGVTSRSAPTLPLASLSGSGILNGQDKDKENGKDKEKEKKKHHFSFSSLSLSHSHSIGHSKKDSKATSPSPSGSGAATPGSLSSGSAMSLPLGGTMSPQHQQTIGYDDMVSSAGGGKGGKKKSSRQKFEERQARKQQELLDAAPQTDPAWTAQLEKERTEEIHVIGAACTAMGRELYEIAPDGHCMFNAIGDQLYQMGIIAAHQVGDSDAVESATNPLYTRRIAAQYMLEHPDAFMPFLPSVNGEDAAGATDDGMMTDKEFKKYCKHVAETGEWGGEPEIQALSRVFKVPIHVIQRGPPTVVSHGGEDDSFGGAMTPEQSAKQGDGVVRISYHRRTYGLGEHYNSLRKVVL